MAEKQFFSQDTETEILSTILKEPEKLYVINDIEDFMFTSEANKRLYKTLNDLITDNLTPDLGLLTSFLESRNELDVVGGAEYLKYLFAKEPNSTNLKEYERILINNYKARSLISVATRAVTEMTNSDDVEAVLSNTKNQLDRLMLTSGGESVQDISTALKLSWDNIIYRINNPGLRGYPFGIKSIDAILGGIGQGDVWVLAARTSQGKTAMMCNSILSAASQGIPCLVFSLEMNRQAFSERLIAIASGVPVIDIRLGNINQKQLNQITEAVAKIKSYPIYLDTNFSVNLNYVESNIRKQHRNNGIKLVYIDYLQLLSERGEDDTKELGRISRKIKLLSNELDIGTVMLAQLNRKVEERENKRPILSDLRQSGNIEEDADLVLFLYREEYYKADTKNKGLMEFIIRKNRNGPIGTIPLHFDSATNIVTDT